jgi:hypothetical protein
MVALTMTALVVVPVRALGQAEGEAAAAAGVAGQVQREAASAETPQGPRAGNSCGPGAAMAG